MKKAIVAMLAMLLFLSPVNVYADTPAAVWAEAEAEEKEVTVTVLTDGSTTSGVLTLNYDDAVFNCEEADVVKADGVEMYAVNVKDNTVKISYVAKKAVAEGVMFTISFDSASNVSATQLASFAMAGEAYTSNGTSVKVGTVSVEDDTNPENPGDSETPGGSGTPGGSETPGGSGTPEDDKSDVITKEDVEDAKENAKNEVTQEGGKEVVTLGNALTEDVTIKAETSIVSKDAFFVMKTVEDGTVFDATVEVIEEKLENVGEFEVIEINLYDGDGTALTQLDGYVAVTIPVPEHIQVRDGYVLVVYRVNDDGTLTNCNAVVKDGKITFTTDHFSTYIIAEQEEGSVITPETGDNTPVMGYVVLLAVAAVAIGMGLKVKKAE